jgi:hypothetical protein
MPATDAAADSFLSDSLDYSQREFRSFETERFFPNLLRQTILVKSRGPKVSLRLPRCWSTDFRKNDVRWSQPQRIG